MKRTVWVNAYKDNNHNTQLYNTKADAINNRDRLVGWFGAFPCEIDVPECDHVFAEPICIEIIGWFHQCEKCKEWFPCETPKAKEPIKMTVPIVPPDDARGTFIVRLELPVEAKNIRCTYEVDK